MMTISELSAQEARMTGKTPGQRSHSAGVCMTFFLCAMLAAACGRGDVTQVPITGSADNPIQTDSVYGTPPDPIPTDPQPLGYLFIPSERLVAWRALRDQNHVMWQTAVNVCNRTGQPNERYGDIGMWCAIIAATNNDPAAASRAILKLRQAMPNAHANTIREEFTAKVLMMDLLRPWLTPADRAVIDPVLDTWPHNVGDARAGDSDAFVGEGCGAMLWNRFNGRAPGYPNVTPMLSQYLVKARGGQWIESSQYNVGTLTLLAMCNLATRTATGSDIVPGVSAFLAEAGRVAAMEVTPDFEQAIQWGADQYPRDFRGRLYRRLSFLAGMPSPEAQWSLQQLMARHWQVSSEQLMSYGLFLWRQDIGPAAPATVSTHVADGIGMLYRRDGQTLAFASAINNPQVDHGEFAAPFNIQLYRNGWLLTNPIAYYGLMSHELAVNGPVYAGLAYFANRRMTWSATGSNWAAIAGEVSGQYFAVDGYPPPPDFLHYGGRVVVHATVNGDPVIIVRDSVHMDDPRTLAQWPGGYRQNSTYQHQARINEFDGKMWAIWHMPVSPTVSGAMLDWSAPNGTPVRLQAFADQPVTVVVRDENTVFGSDITPAERKWQARLHSDAPVLFQVFTVGNVAVSRTGNAVTVGGQTWTITSAGVAGP